MENNLEHCCICNEKTNTVYTLPFIEIFGMAKKYKQRINLCPKCGFIYTANPFSEQAFGERYRNMSKYEFDIKDEIINEDISYKKRCYRQYHFIKNVMEDIKSIFEVGAASGYNLNIYASEGIDAYGVEPSAANVSSAKKRYGVDMFCGMFSDYIMAQGTAWASKKYDLIFLSHTLEHIINPYKFLRELSEINSRYIFIEVPTLDYKFCDEPFGMFTDEHVNYFTFDNLRNLMKTLGYHVADANIYFGTGEDVPSGHPCISTLWEKDNELNARSLMDENKVVISSAEMLEKYLQCSEQNYGKIGEIIDGIDRQTRLAVWGTGNHTSKLLAMTNLGKKNIVKFYDSDMRKKGVSYFGKEIMPFNIEDIKSGEVEKIIISSYVSQKVIVDVVRKMDADIAAENLVLLY